MTCLLSLLLFLPAEPPAPVRIVCLGDSVTKGVRPGVNPDDTFCVQLERAFKAAGVEATVINAGVGGNKTSQGLARFQRDVLAHQPTHVVLMFGLNDSWIDAGKTESRLSVADYEANLRKMVALLRERKITPVLMTPNPVAPPRYPPERNRTLKAYVNAVRDVARQEKVQLIDVYAHLAEKSLEGTDLNTLFTDGMHPNPRGHTIIAELMFQELGIGTRQRK